jgi:uncharacterized cysteine cluster protein YcgN (CxxCxxCC family)
LKPFWERKTFAEMDQKEWESLCDGCARCCMIKLQDDETEEVFYTSIVCDLLDQNECRCTRYPERHKLVENCVQLSPEKITEFDWLPTSCAYRTLAEGRKLQWWHPLLSGRQETVHQADISVRGKVVAKSQIREDDEQDMIIHWVETTHEAIK